MLLSQAMTAETYNFLARRSRKEDITLRVYTTRFWVGAKSSPTCANYALHQLAKDNAKDYGNLFKALQRNFCQNDFLNILSKSGLNSNLLSKGGLNLTKGIAIDEEVKSLIPEPDR